MKKLFIVSLLSIAINMFGQNVVKLTPKQIETIFIHQNLELISEKLNIDIAQAEISQAKVWENPEISFSDINLWSSESQRDDEDIPPLFGGFGKNRQFNIELSQLISTANKKGKEAKIAKIAKQMTIEEFEDLLRNLKLELRITIYETIFLQSLSETLLYQRESMNQLITAFKKQFEMGNIAKTELLRLQAARYELEGQVNETNTELNSNLSELKSLLSCDPMTEIYIIDENKLTLRPTDFNLNLLFEEMVNNRPDLRKSLLQIEMSEKFISLEKANRIPDLNLSVAYDRRGGVWRDYVGFGLSFDIPLWDRNQNVIKIAKFERDQSVIENKQNVLSAQNEVIEAYKNYELAYYLLKDMSDENILEELENMYSAYEKNLLKKNVSMLEFIDFTETYLSNKELYLEAKKNKQIAFETLQNAVGIELF